MIIGITGTDGAGKGTVVDFLLAQKGFVHYSARSLFVQEIERQGIENNRANMRLVANQLRTQNGDDMLVTHFIVLAEKRGIQNIIIESIRAVAEAVTLKSKGGILLAVDANQQVRYERITSRASSSDNISFEDFIAHEQMEMNDPDPHGMQKAKVMEMADYTIMNDGSLEQLHSQVEDFLKNFQ